MTDTISNLTRAAFDRAWENWDGDDPDEFFSRLVTEANRREPLQLWAIIDLQGYEEPEIFFSLRDAESDLKTWDEPARARIVKLIESEAE